MKKIALLLAALFLGGEIVGASAKAKPAQSVVLPETMEKNQNPAAKAEAGADFSLFGAVGFVYSENTYALTCTGPRVGFKYADYWISAGFYPSILYSTYYRDQNAATPVRLHLGAGFEIGYKHISILVPFYHLPNNTYHWTVGLAYKFS